MIDDKENVGVGLKKHDPPSMVSILAWSCSLAVCALVVSRAWISDDAFITLRYVLNTLDGHGPVFNIGERVQGFTHPCWFLLLVLTGWMADLPLVAVLLGVVCTFATVQLVVRMLAGTATYLLAAITVFGVQVTSDTYLEFQTSGLENALTNLLLVALIFEIQRTQSRGNSPGDMRMGRLFLYLSLIVLNRLDHAILLLPVVCSVATMALRHKMLGGCVLKLGLASLPLIAWYGFATVYYGIALPNTYFAKVGALGSGESIYQGLVYLADYVHHEPLAALMLALCLPLCVLACRLATGAIGVREILFRALGFGVVFQLAYVVAVGGDFMRGRFLVSIQIVTLTVGALLLSKMLNTRQQWVFALSIVLLATAGRSGVAAQDIVKNNGIVRESAVYVGQWLANATRTGIGSRRGHHGKRLRDYAERHGPITISEGAVGSYSFYAGPLVTVLDDNGLTDAFISRCPPRKNVRIGHFHRLVPDDYFRVRGAMDRLPNWKRRVKNLDPTLRAMAEVSRTGSWYDPRAEAVWREITLLTSGDIFDPKRLRLIPKYFLRSPRWWDQEFPVAETSSSIRIRGNYQPEFGSFSNILELRNKPDGIHWHDSTKCVSINNSSSELVLDLGSICNISSLALQADPTDTYIVDFRARGSDFEQAWQAISLKGKGMTTRSTAPGFVRTARYLRIRASGGDGKYAISKIEIEYDCRPAEEKRPVE